MKESFLLFTNNEENFKMLSNSEKGKLIMAIFAFVRDEDISATLSPVAKMAYISITQQIKICNEKYDKRCETSRENGKLGGRPRKNVDQNTPENINVDNSVDKNVDNFEGKNLNNLKKPNETDRLLGFDSEKGPEENLKNLKKPNQNLKNLKKPYMIYDNDIDRQQNNIFNDYNACAHACVRERTEEERKPFKDFYNDEIFQYGLSDKRLKIANEIIDTMLEALEQSDTADGLKFKSKQYDAISLLEKFSKVDAYGFGKIITHLASGDVTEIENRAVYILSSLLINAEDKRCANKPENIAKLKSSLLNLG